MIKKKKTKIKTAPLGEKGLKLINIYPYLSGNRRCKLPTSEMRGVSEQVLQALITKESYSNFMIETLAT
jgi:hypothetical protein